MSYRVSHSVSYRVSHSVSHRVSDRVSHRVRYRVSHRVSHRATPDQPALSQELLLASAPDVPPGASPVGSSRGQGGHVNSR